jgi:hypothetical protein
LKTIIYANEKALFTPTAQILKGQKEYYNLELDEHKYLSQVKSTKLKVKSENQSSNQLASSKLYSNEDAPINQSAKQGEKEHKSANSLNPRIR